MPDEEDLDFEIEFYEGVLELSPDFQEALMCIGNAYTRRGKYEDGLQIDRKLATLRPQDPVVFYNLSCSYSLLSEIESAFDALEKAIELGYRDFPHLMSDPDLENLRNDPRFAQIILSHFKG